MAESYLYKKKYVEPGFESSIRKGTGKTKTISITSGKGGVGKTSLLSNLATDLANIGNKVLILDGDFGMANVDIMFNVRTRKTINDVFTGDALLEEIITEVRPNVFLVPGGSGIYDLQNLSAVQKMSLLNQVSELETDFDYMLIDTAPGIDDNVLFLNSAVDEVMIVLTPDPASLMDSYALIKVLNKKYKTNEFSVVCNMVKDTAEGNRMFAALNEVVSNFLFVRLNYKGAVPMDLNLRKATKLQQLILDENPRSPSSFSIRDLSKNISNFSEIRETNGSIQFFWKQILSVV